MEGGQTASLDPEAIALSLPEDQGPWLIATDAADLIAAPLHRLLYALRREGRTDVRLLLAARQSDWHAAGAAKLNWRQHADYQEQPLSGLTEPDALVIAASWGHFGDGGARGADPPALLGRRLFEAARDEAAVDEGALLGGMLLVRKGAGLKDPVRTLLDRLGQARLDAGGTLYQAFAYIAAVHAEGLDFLSPPVLAQALGCDPRVLRAQVIQPLGREAAAGGGSVLLTRHRRIAQAAVELMRDEFGDDVDGRYVELAWAAMQIRSTVQIPSVARWEYDLPERFLESRPELALRIAGAVLAEDPENAHLAVNLARTYRETSDPAAGAQVLAGFSGPVRHLRGFWCEWGPAPETRETAPSMPFSPGGPWPIRPPPRPLTASARPLPWPVWVSPSAICIPATGIRYLWKGAARVPNWASVWVPIGRGIYRGT